MKFLHISDLHIGKRVNEFSMVDEQNYILNRILAIAEEEQAEGVMIAGDIYDKAAPSAEAVQIFDRFLTGLARQNRKVFLISGNHDSAERIAYGSQIMKDREIYISPVYNGTAAKIELSDTYGSLFLYLLPFVKPAVVRHVLEQEQAKDLPESYHEAVKAAIDRMEADPAERNILVAHQFVTGAGRCDSEELPSGYSAMPPGNSKELSSGDSKDMPSGQSGNSSAAHMVSVGGIDNVDAWVFDAFDYVALGHIHSPQSVGRETIRYCGTPLKYSFSEAGQEKSVTVVDFREKGQVELRMVPLVPLHDMRMIRGTYLEVTARSFYQGMDTEDYLKITLTDEEDVPDAMQKLRLIYPNLMRLEYDNSRTRDSRAMEAAEDMEQKSELELFEEFYELQNNQPMSEEQTEYVRQMIEGML